MSWILDLSTRAKLLTSFGAVALLFTVMNYAIIMSVEEKLQELSFDNLGDLSSMHYQESENRINLLLMMLYTDRGEQERLADAIHQGADRVDELAEGLRVRNAGDAPFLKALDDWKEARTAYNDTRLNTQIPAILAGELESAKKLALGVQAQRLSKKHDLVKRMEEKAKAEMVATFNGVKRGLEETQTLVQTVGSGAILLALALAFGVSRLIATPLKEVTLAAERMAAGDLTAHVEESPRRDEVGALAHTFREMLSRLREMTVELRDGITVLSSSASEIMATTSQVASGASQTGSAVTEVSSTVEEVKQTAHLASDKARHVADNARKAADISATGMGAMEGLGEAMEKIQGQMRSIADSIVTLSEQSQSIGEIINTVNDLSEQSNILAVNAGIEAAKAGDAGKGFSVVAQEVKSLADQSKQATIQVRAILKDVQKATSAAVMATEQGGKTVAEGMERSKQAADSIRLLAKTVTDHAVAANQIAASAQQQLVGMEQIAQAMASIKESGLQNVAGTRQAETAAHGLHELGGRLRLLVERYQV